MLVGAAFAEWLRSPELVELATRPEVIGPWGALAADSRVSSPFALRADAAAEGVRQLAFLGDALAVETIEVTGYHSGVVGLARRIKAPVAEYEGGAAVFVVAAEERETGTTLLTVLRKVIPT